MKHIKKLKHEFVEYIPNNLDDGVIYISIPFATAAHKCCCGCGMEVVTPISPTDWQLTFNGEAISLYPSIGNWSFDCKSHYWIRENAVKWSLRWTQDEIKTGRSRDMQNKKRSFDSAKTSPLLNMINKITKHGNDKTKNFLKKKK